MKTREPRLEKHPHAYGVEYCWVHGDRVLGCVTPVAPQNDPLKPRLWRATVGRRVVGIFASNSGRQVALRAVQHFTKHMWCGEAYALGGRR